MLVWPDFLPLLRSAQRRSWSCDLDFSWATGMELQPQEPELVKSWSSCTVLLSLIPQLYWRLRLSIGALQPAYPCDCYKPESISQFYYPRSTPRIAHHEPSLSTNSSQLLAPDHPTHSSALPATTMPILLAASRLQVLLPPIHPQSSHSSSL